MNAERAVAVRTQYPARPGRRVIVVTDLASLRGPTRGTVGLPLRLYWSGPSPAFDLGEPYLRRWLYQIVLREASRPEDLTGLPGPGHADRAVAGAAPAQGRAAGLGGASSAAAGRRARGGLMPVSALHRRVAAVALAAAAVHGFALGGGNALLAHGVISRPTQDVDLFTDQEHGVQAAAGAVQAALRRAGFQAVRQGQAGGLSDMFPDIGEGLAEWIVTAAAGEQMLLQLAYFDRGRQPVVMDIGPVLDLEDAVVGKVCALASRVEPRDYADVAAALERYSPAQLIGFARRLDPGLTGEDFAYAGVTLDQMDDRAFAEIRLSQHQVTTLPERFAAWPRHARTASQEPQPGDPAQHRPGREQPPAARRPGPGTDDPHPAGGRQHQRGQEPAAQAAWEDPEAEP